MIAVTSRDTDYPFTTQGRSAFQPAERADEGHDAKDATINGELHDSDSATWRQQYNAVGRPINPASNELKAKLQAAHDSILRTVGFSARDYEQLTRRKLVENRRKTILGDLRETQDGETFVQVDAIPFCLQLFGETGIRYRVQAFKSLSEVSLSSIILNGVRSEGLLSFMLAGCVSRAVAIVLMRALGQIPRRLMRTRKAVWTASTTQNCLKLLGCLLIAPFRIHEVLCRLGCVPARQILPSPASYNMYLTGCLGIYEYAPGLPLTSKIMKHLKSNHFRALISFFVALSGFRIMGALTIKYVTASFAAQEFEFQPANSQFHLLDGRLQVPSSTQALRHAFHDPTVTDLAAKDLQAIGRWARRSWDRMLAFFHLQISLDTVDKDDRDALPDSPARRSSTDTVPELPDDLREAMGIMTPRGGTPRPPNNVLGMPADLHDLLDPMVDLDAGARLRQANLRQQTQNTPSPLAVEVPSDISEHTGQHPEGSLDLAGDRGATIEPGNTEESSRNPGGPAPPVTRSYARSVGTSRSTSRSQSPSRGDRVEISATYADNGDTALQFSIPIDLGNSTAQRGFRLPSSSSTTSSDESPMLSIADDEPSESKMRLRDFPERAFTSIVSYHLTRIIMWPVEAVFVRNVALAFGPEGAMRSDIIRQPFRSWLGWSTFFKHTEKTLLICGIPLVIGLTVWQLEYQCVWWLGRRRHNWRQPQRPTVAY